jgi:hypothetical protein
MTRATLMYVVGFGSVWGAVGLWCTAMAVVRSFTRDWDRAFQRELLGDRLLVASCRAGLGSGAGHARRFEREP